MGSPWTKKNPVAAAQADAAKQIVDFWSGKAAAPRPKQKGQSG